MRAAQVRKLLAIEVAIVLVLSFGTSGLRSLLRLISALLDPTPLNEQSTTLHAQQVAVPWLDLGLQVLGAATLFSWGCLALYLLWPHHKLAMLHARDWGWGALLAAVIGIPGLAFYLSALHLGLSKEVVPTTLEHLWWEVPVLLLYSAANAFAEEIVVVFYFITRLRELRCGVWPAIVLAALLRGSYHLYQGVSAGVGNVVMGLLFGWVFVRYGKVWPLVLAHFLIDAVAFVGYSAAAGTAVGAWLGI